MSCQAIALDRDLEALLREIEMGRPAGRHGLTPTQGD